MENRLVGNRRHIRALLVDRALLQHESRLLERSNTVFTTGHQKVLENLLELVRKTTQSAKDCNPLFSLLSVGFELRILTVFLTLPALFRSSHINIFN